MLDALYHAIDPVAFAVGPFSVRWYGLGYVVSFILAGFILYNVAKRWRLDLSVDSVLTIMIFAILGTIIGARVGYCLFYGNGYYFAHPLEVFAVNEGGMSFHGGLAGVLLGGIISARITKIHYLTLADLGVIAAAPALFIVRCANFINGELWGAPTDLPWGVVFGGSAGDMPRHPSQLYEGFLEGVVIFTVLWVLSRRYPPRPRGTFIGLFLLLYGTFRILVEFVREPDVQLGYLFGDWLTMGMLLSIPLVLAGIALLIYAHMRKLPQTAAGSNDPELAGSEALKG